MTGIYWERVDIMRAKQTTYDKHQAAIDTKLGEINTKVASIEATLNLAVRRQIRVDIEGAPR